MVSLAGDVFMVTTLFSFAAGETAILTGSGGLGGWACFSDTLMVGGLGESGAGRLTGVGAGVGGSFFGVGGFWGGVLGFGGSFFGVGVLDFWVCFFGLAGFGFGGGDFGAGFGGSFLGEGGLGFGGSFLGDCGLGAAFFGGGDIGLWVVGSSLSVRILGGGGAISASAFLLPFKSLVFTGSAFFFLGIPFIGPVLPLSQYVFISPFPCTNVHHQIITMFILTVCMSFAENKDTHCVTFFFLNKTMKLMHWPWHLWNPFLQWNKGIWKRHPPRNYSHGSLTPAKVHTTCFLNLRCQTALYWRVWLVCTAILIKQKLQIILTHAFIFFYVLPRCCSFWKMCSLCPRKNNIWDISVQPLQPQQGLCVLLWTEKFRTLNIEPISDADSFYFLKKVKAANLLSIPKRLVYLFVVVCAGCWLGPSWILRRLWNPVPVHRCGPDEIQFVPEPLISPCTDPLLFQPKTLEPLFKVWRSKNLTAQQTQVGTHWTFCWNWIEEKARKSEREGRMPCWSFWSLCT